MRSLARTWTVWNARSFIATREETAIFCCSVFDVRNTTWRPDASPCASAGWSAAAVLPEPVGASAIRFSPEATALRIASISFSWIGRGAVCGKGSRSAAAALRWRAILELRQIASARARRRSTSCSMSSSNGTSSESSEPVSMST